MSRDPAVDGPPEKYKPESEWEVEDFLHRARTGERPISDEYRNYRNEVLKRAGLDDEIEEPGGKPVEEMTTADHHEHVRSDWK